MSHFILCLACAGASFFAWQRGIPQAVYAADASMMTSAIAVLVIVTAVLLGRQAWRADFAIEIYPNRPVYYKANSDFGHYAEPLSVALGLIGTGIGLYLQAKAAPGDVNFTALTTMVGGVVGYALIKTFTFNLESGINRAAR